MCKELVSLIGNINKLSNRYEICGILDDDPALAGKLCYGYRVLGPIDRDNLTEDCKCVLSVATSRDIALRAAVASRLDLEKEKWARIIHPQATVATDAEVDPGAILYPGSRLAPATKVGVNAFLYYNSVLHHDSSVGDYTQVCAGVLIAGRVTVGQRCYLGIGSMIRDNVRVADDTMIGMGAVVTKDILLPGQLFKGIPAKASLLRDNGM